MSYPPKPLDDIRASSWALEFTEMPLLEEPTKRDVVESKVDTNHRCRLGPLCPVTKLLVDLLHGHLCEPHVQLSD